MRRGARFLLLDESVPASAEADYIVLDVRPEQLRSLIRKLEACASFAERLAASDPAVLRPRGPRRTGFSVRLPVEASHPKMLGPDGVVAEAPSLLKESIPRSRGGS